MSVFFLAHRSLFDESGCLERWFHGTMSREKAGQAIQEWEASNGKKHGASGVFLFRYTSNRVRSVLALSLLPCGLEEHQTGFSSCSGTHSVVYIPGWFQTRSQVRIVQSVLIADHSSCSVEPANLFSVPSSFALLRCDDLAHFLMRFPCERCSINGIIMIPTPASPQLFAG